jgi:hypothetical protein
MALEKRTVLVSHEFMHETGDLQLKFEKRVVDGDVILMREPHRSIVNPGVSVDDQIAAVSDHLVNHLGFPPVGKTDVDALRSIVSTKIISEKRSAGVVRLREAR